MQSLFSPAVFPLRSSFEILHLLGEAFRPDETRKQRSVFSNTFRRGRVCGFGDFGGICRKVLKAGSTALIEQRMPEALAESSTVQLSLAVLPAF